METEGRRRGEDSHASIPKPKAEARRTVDELSSTDLESVYADQFAPGRAFENASSWSGAPLRNSLEDPLLGRTLHGAYVVNRVLGEGGMGRVYEASHTRIASKRYALKVLRPEYAQNADVRRRFQREAEAAATIEHHGVVGTYDVGETLEGWPYIVCEYLAGIDLYDYLRRHGALPAATVVHVGMQLCSALAAAHERGIIHRDLKPHNVFVVQRDGRSGEPEPVELHPSDLPLVKVLDFGLSRFVEKDNELTRAGVILGTPGYMAPEQANGQETDTRTDIYGIGALLYATATGRAPFQEETPQQTVLAVMSQEPPRPRELSPHLPVSLEVIIQKAMARDPRARFQSAQEMGAALSVLGLHDPARSRARTGMSPEVFSVPPRVALVLYAAFLALFAGISLLTGGCAVLELKGIDYRSFRPSALEWILLGLLATMLSLVTWLSARTFARKVWNNSARVAALNPRLRGPIVAGLLAYGLSALAVRSVAALAGIRAGSLAVSPLPTSPVLYVILPTIALLAGSSVALKDLTARMKGWFVRSVARVGYPAGAFAASLLLLVHLVSSQPTEGSVQAVASTSAAEVSLAPPPLIDDPEQLRAEEPEAAHSDEPHDAAEQPAAPSPGEAPSASPSTEPSPDSPSEDSLAPREVLAVASEEGPAALEQLSARFPRDTGVLKTLVLAYASRADTLDRSVKAIARLLQVDPKYQQDSDILFILKKGLRSKTRAFSVASDTVKQMGPQGAELLFELMNEFPDQRKRLKGLFQEMRQENMASPQVLVAYDLRYAPSCHARLDSLEQAEKYGDIRSLRQLQALSTAPKRCGWGRTCYPPCRAEAERFKKSAAIIDQRLSRAAP